jgi:ABC-type sugar transport system permease subunit
MEGSSRPHTLHRVTLPLMAPVLGLFAAPRRRAVAAGVVRRDLPRHRRGPDRATLFLPIYVYDVGFEQLRYGYAP